MESTIYYHQETNFNYVVNRGKNEKWLNDTEGKISTKENLVFGDNLLEKVIFWKKLMKM